MATHRIVANFDEIDELAQGFRSAQILFTACQLGLFDALRPGPMKLDEIASRLNLEARGARILCDAAAALGLLEKTNEGYANTEAGRRYLCSDRAESRLATLHHGSILYRRWGHLGDSVRTGRPVSDESMSGDQPMHLDKPAFARAMAEIGRQSAVQVSRALDLTRVRRMLDIGGGPGMYALEFARRAPGLEIVVMDDAETLEVARDNLRGSEVAGRISLRMGDAFTDELGENYDLIFLSNFIHIYSADQNRALIHRCSRALAPGGRLVIKDFILNADRISPVGCALFAVNMLVSTDTGDVYSADQIEGWFEAAGLWLERIVPVTTQSSLVIGRKAGG